MPVEIVLVETVQGLARGEPPVLKFKRGINVWGIMCTGLQYYDITDILLWL